MTESFPWYAIQDAYDDDVTGAYPSTEDAYSGYGQAASIQYTQATPSDIYAVCTKEPLLYMHVPIHQWSTHAMQYVCLGDTVLCTVGVVMTPVGLITQIQALEGKRGRAPGPEGLNIIGRFRPPVCPVLPFTSSLCMAVIDV